MQVSQLIAEIGDEQAPNPFSIGFDRGKQMTTAGFDIAMPVELDTEGLNNQVAVQREARKAEIAQKCLTFTRKMSKAIDKIGEYV